MPALYSYVLRYDNGTAPNPFWNTCTLTICKPAIRRTASIGDWVIGTGSKHAQLQDGKEYDFSDSLIYAMKVTAKLSLAEYDAYCRLYLPNKIPQLQSADRRLHAGDCVYAYTDEPLPAIRESMHSKEYLPRDLGGHNALLSDHFYYFGAAAVHIPFALRHIIKRNQGHSRIENELLLAQFTDWISGFELNKLYGDPVSPLVH